MGRILDYVIEREEEKRVRVLKDKNIVNIYGSWVDLNSVDAVVEDNEMYTYLGEEKITERSSIILKSGALISIRKSVEDIIDAMGAKR